MIKRKSIYIIISTLIILLLAVGGLYFLKINKEYSWSIAIGCEGKSYEQKENIGYLSFEYLDGKNSRIIVLSVEDEALQQVLSSSVPEDIIGLHMQHTVSYKILTEYHIDVNNIKPFEILANKDFDKYLKLLSVSIE